MSARLRERKYQEKTTRGNGKNPANIAVLGVFLAIGVFFLIPLFPPFGLIWCFVIGKSLLKELEMQGVVKKNVEGKYTIDKNKAKTVGKRDFDDMREKYKARIIESNRMDERLPREHSHTPTVYSYDACAMERRLEQIKSLKDAGILDEKEYQQRKARILAGQ